MLKNVIEEFLIARKRAKKFKCSINEDWFNKLFDLSRCRCEILETVGTYRGRLLCICKFDDRIPEKEIEFLKDQRSSRKMILSESKNMVFNKHRQQVFAKTPNIAETDQEQPICSKRIKITDTPSAIFPAVLRSHKSDTCSIFDDNDDEIVAKRPSFTETFDLDYHLPSKQIAGSTVGEKYISVSLVFREREQFGLEALKKWEKELGRAAAIQLCYDGNIINKMDRYIGAIRR